MELKMWVNSEHLLHMRRQYFFISFRIFQICVCNSALIEPVIESEGHVESIYADCVSNK